MAGNDISRLLFPHDGVADAKRWPATIGGWGPETSVFVENYTSLAGLFITGEDAPVGCHNMGVARMSADPKDGVTNRWGQAHDIPNLFVSDGSLFSSSGAANPTLTIVALAIRQAEHIAERMAQKEL